LLLLLFMSGQAFNTSSLSNTTLGNSTVVAEVPDDASDDAEFQLNLTEVASNASSEDSNDSKDDDMEYAGMIDILDEVSLEDEALVLAHIDSDIDDFEDLKRTIAFLEQHVRKHADINVVKSKELIAADKVLKELDVKVATFYEHELQSLKSQVSNLDHKFDKASMEEISTIVENAEMFLQLSMDKIEELEIIEQEWEVTEESAKIQEMIDQDEAKAYSSKILLKALKPSVGEEFKDKLRDMEEAHDPRIVKASTLATTKPSVRINDNSSMYRKMRKMNMMNREEKEPNIKEALTMDGIDNKEVESEVSEQEDPDKGIVIEESDEGDVIEDLDQWIVDDESEHQKLILSDEDTKYEKKDEDNSEHRIKGSDAVEHYSNKVRDALNTAKDMSHKFLDKALRHTETVSDGGEQATSVPYLYIVIFMLALLVLVISCIAFRTFVRRRRVKVVMQNLSGFGSNERCYTELESVKGDSGWGRSWSPWNTNKKRQNKFK